MFLCLWLVVGCFALWWYGCGLLLCFLGCVMLFCYGCLIGRFCLLFADVYGCALWLTCVGFDVIGGWWLVMVVGLGWTCGLRRGFGCERFGCALVVFLLFYV